MEEKNEITNDNATSINTSNTSDSKDANETKNTNEEINNEKNKFEKFENSREKTENNQERAEAAERKEKGAMESKLNNFVSESETFKNENEDEKFQDLNNKIVEQKEQLDEAEDRIKRLMAEFENFKKRSEKERQAMYSSVMGDVVTSLLPAIDNLEKAADAETEDKQYQEGVKMVLNQIKDVLKANNVTEIEAVGKPFDPSLHEAVSMVEDPDLGSKIVKEEFRKGYMIGDRVLRHSMVVVAN